ncbi:MAG: AtpZ/AtpI family protein [Candidatus Paceibacterota bacterium]
MNDKKVKDLWWKPAVMIFSNVSAWIAFPIILALILGKYLDKKYDSAPWFFIGLTILSFIVSITGIWKILKKYIKEIEEEANNKKLENKSNGNNNRI